MAQAGGRQATPHGVRSMKPRWIISKYHSVCAYCEQAIMPGDRVLWFPDDKAVACPGCVEVHELEENDSPHP